MKLSTSVLVAEHLCRELYNIVLLHCCFIV
nr:MAG TPA: hypothetical protein [Caudoviricetes sp.]